MRFSGFIECSLCSATVNAATAIGNELTAAARENVV